MNDESTILAADIGTTATKMGVFQAKASSLIQVVSYSQSYPINSYNNGLFSDIDPETWKQAFIAGCRNMRDHMPKIDVIALSGTTPGLTAMDREGNALYPAILMLDQRSRSEAQDIINTIGLDKLLAETGNMPVAGGCSLASILWLRNHYPELYRKVACFGHSNTHVAKWLTGYFSIDPSSASLSALYNTSMNDLTWNKDIAETFGLSLNQLPRLIPASDSGGRVRKNVADSLSLRKRPHVVIGGNDAVLAAFSAGIQEPGDVINVNGTCEITLVCLPKCSASTRYNVRAHVLPDRWLTLYVMNAGGKAYEWFKNLFCREMSDQEFFGEFVPRALSEWLERESAVTYVPYLMGSRYSLEPFKAEFLGLTYETTRDEFLAALVRGLCVYQREHLKEISLEFPLNDRICVTGGALNEAILKAKNKWMKTSEYVPVEQSSLKGAAMLGSFFLENR